MLAHRSPRDQVDSASTSSIDHRLARLESPPHLGVLGQVQLEHVRLGVALRRRDETAWRAIRRPAGSSSSACAPGRRRDLVRSSASPGRRRACSVMVSVISSNVHSSRCSPPCRSADAKCGWRTICALQGSRSGTAPRPRASAGSEQRLRSRARQPEIPPATPATAVARIRRAAPTVRRACVTRCGRRERRQQITTREQRRTDRVADACEAPSSARHDQQSVAVNR